MQTTLFARLAALVLLILISNPAICLSGSSDRVGALGGLLGHVFGTDDEGAGSRSNSAPISTMGNIDPSALIGVYELDYFEVRYSTGQIINSNQIQVTGHFVIIESVMLQRIVIIQQVVVATGTWTLSGNTLTLNNDFAVPSNAQVSYDGTRLTTVLTIPQFTETDVWRKIKVPDLTGDWKLDLEDVIYVLQVLSGQR